MMRIVLVAITAFILGLTGCRYELDVSMQSKANTPPAVQGESEVSAPADYNAAVEMAHRTKKDLLLIFGASWCGPCNKMKQNVWSDIRVQKAMDRYVVYYVDTDREKALSQSHGVRGIPAYGIYTVNGNSTVSSKKFATGYRDVSWILSWLN